MPFGDMEFVESKLKLFTAISFKVFRISPSSSDLLYVGDFVFHLFCY